MFVYFKRKVLQFLLNFGENTMIAFCKNKIEQLLKGLKNI